MIFEQADPDPSALTAPSNFPIPPLRPITQEELEKFYEPEPQDENEVPDFIMNIGSGPKLDGKTPKQRRPPFKFPPGVPMLDASWEAAYGPPVNEWDAGARHYARMNPSVWCAVVMAAQIEIANGRKFSFRTIGEKIRWSNVPGYDSSKPYKIANGYTPYFARYFRHFFPIVSDYADIQD